MSLTENIGLAVVLVMITVNNKLGAVNLISMMVKQGLEKNACLVTSNVLWTRFHSRISVVEEGDDVDRRLPLFLPPLLLLLLLLLLFLLLFLLLVIKGI